MSHQPDIKDTRIVFMGSPVFSVPILRALNEKTNVVAAVTQPDRPTGRGKKIVPCAVKQAALELGLHVLTPNRLRKDEDSIAELKELQADVFIVAAYGQILPMRVLEIPKYGCVNVHASLLPRWRGASPIQTAILEGDAQTGVTIMKMNAGMDTGPILKKKAISIKPSDNAETLSEKLSLLGRDLLLEVLLEYICGTLKPVQQEDEEATYTTLIKKKDGVMDLSNPAAHLERQVRAYNPWPGTYFEWNEKRLKVLETEVVNEVTLGVGERSIFQKYPVIGTGDGVLKLTQVQVPGKKPTSGKAFLNGARDWKQ